MSDYADFDVMTDEQKREHDAFLAVLRITHERGAAAVLDSLRPTHPVSELPDTTPPFTREEAAKLVDWFKGELSMLDSESDPSKWDHDDADLADFSRERAMLVRRYLAAHPITPSEPPDEARCGTRSPARYICTLAKGHDGPHEAHANALNTDLCVSWLDAVTPSEGIAPDSLADLLESCAADREQEGRDARSPDARDAFTDDARVLREHAARVRLAADGNVPPIAPDTVDESWFGCFTGDCPHGTRVECDAAIRAEFIRLTRENERLRAPDTCPTPTWHLGTIGNGSAPRRKAEQCAYCKQRMMYPLRFDDHTNIRTFTCLNPQCEYYRRLIDEDDGDNKRCDDPEEVPPSAPDTKADEAREPLTVLRDVGRADLILALTEAAEALATRTGNFTDQAEATYIEEGADIVRAVANAIPAILGLSSAVVGKEDTARVAEWRSAEAFAAWLLEDDNSPGRKYTALARAYLDLAGKVDDYIRAARASLPPQSAPEEPK